MHRLADRRNRPESDIAARERKGSSSDVYSHAIAIGKISKLRVHVTGEPNMFRSLKPETILRGVTPAFEDWQNRKTVTLTTAQPLSLRSKLVYDRLEKPLSDNGRITQSFFEVFQNFGHRLQSSGPGVESSYRTGRIDEKDIADCANKERGPAAAK